MATEREACDCGWRLPMKWSALVRCNDEECHPIGHDEETSVSHCLSITCPTCGAEWSCGIDWKPGVSGSFGWEKS